MVEGAIEIGVRAISAYAFSTENWSRSADEVKFLMGFNRDVIRRRRDEMHALGVRVRWAGRAPRLWRSVIEELQVAEEMTRDNDVLTLTMCVNYGGRAELADAARAIGQDVAAGRLNPDRIDERTFARYLYVPELADADLVWRTSGEQRLSNFMLWQAAYSEMVFSDVLWPDVDRRDLWAAIETYARRNRRYGGALTRRIGSPPGADDAVRDLRMRYGDDDVLTGVDFDVDPGRWSACSAPTARARPPRSRSSRASGSARRARSGCWAGPGPARGLAGPHGCGAAVVARPSAVDAAAPAQPAGRLLRAVLHARAAAPARRRRAARAWSG